MFFQDDFKRNSLSGNIPGASRLFEAGVGIVGPERADLLSKRDKLRHIVKSGETHSGPYTSEVETKTPVDSAFFRRSFQDKKSPNSIKPDAARATLPLIRLQVRPPADERADQHLGSRQSSLRYRRFSLSIAARAHSANLWSRPWFPYNHGPWPRPRRVGLRPG